MSVDTDPCMCYCVPSGKLFLFYGHLVPVENLPDHNNTCKPLVISPQNDFTTVKNQVWNSNKMLTPCHELWCQFIDWYRYLLRCLVPLNCACLLHVTTEFRLIHFIIQIQNVCYWIQSDSRSSCPRSPDQVHTTSSVIKYDYCSTKMFTYNHLCAWLSCCIFTHGRWLE